MKYKVKHVVLAVVIEVLLFLLIGRHDAELFFLIANLILIVILVKTTSGHSKSFSRGGWQGNNMNGTPMGNVLISRDMVEPDKPQTLSKKEKDPRKTILQLMLVLNLICFVIVVYFDFV